MLSRVEKITRLKSEQTKIGSVVQFPKRAYFEEKRSVCFPSSIEKHMNTFACPQKEVYSLSCKIEI